MKKYLKMDVRKNIKNLCGFVKSLKFSTQLDKLMVVFYFHVANSNFFSFWAYLFYFIFFVFKFTQTKI